MVRAPPNRPVHISYLQKFATARHEDPEIAIQQMAGPHPKRAWQEPDKVDIKKLQDELQRAASSAINRTLKYDKVAVLLMHFEDDDIGCDDLEDELADTFRKFYGIHKVEQIVFAPKASPRHVLTQAFIRLANDGYTDKGSLVILVFSGHGESRVVMSPEPNQGAQYTLYLG
jgi:hypothetical protein